MSARGLTSREGTVSYTRLAQALPMCPVFHSCRLQWDCCEIGLVSSVSLPLLVSVLQRASPGRGHFSLTSLTSSSWYSKQLPAGQAGFHLSRVLPFPESQERDFLSWRAARDINRHIHPLSTKWSVFNIAPEGRNFWQVLTQNLAKSPLCVKSCLMQEIIFCSCMHVYACVDVYSTSITAMIHCPYVWW